MGIAWLDLLFGRLLNFRTSKNQGKCLLNPTTKKRKTPKPLAGLLRRQNKRKMQEKPLLEGKRKCKLREQLTGKRRLAKLSANKNLAKCIHVTTIGPLLRIHLRTRMGIFKKKLKLNRCL